MRRMIPLLAAGLLLCACPVYAGGSKGTWELGGYGGYGWLDDYGVIHPDNGPLFGGRLGVFLSEHWGLEASGQRLSADTDFDTLGVQNADFHITSFRLNLLYNLGSAASSVRPFLTAGGGYEKAAAEQDVDVWESKDFGWNAGAGLRFFLGRHWNVRAEGRYVRTKVELAEGTDDSQGNVEATLGLGFLFGGKHEEVAEAAPPPPNQPPTVSCAAERAEILPGETVNLTATASDPEGGPVTYAWTATSGHVTGTGATVALDFSGTTPPATSAVTVRVTDDHGNVASSDCSVKLMEPVRKAEAVSCVAGGFPRNKARLTNVEKACLDDVAQRLQGDPRAKVTVVGHSDTQETGDIGQQRADAVKAYLKERGIDEARITTRSAGSTKLLDTGTDATARARNRRVEVWFVPEGATIPE